MSFVRDRIRSLADGIAVRRKTRIGTRRVLFACDHPLMANYLSHVSQLLKPDLRLDLAVISDRDPKFRSERQQVVEILEVKEVSAIRAWSSPWDVMIVASHEARPDLADRKRFPTVYIGHGGVGKTLGDCRADYSYGNSAIASDGTPRYARMFATSRPEAQRAVEANPKLKDVVVCVGSAADDVVLSLRERRGAIREELGFASDETIVFVTSTWGPTCLFRRFGEVLFEEMRNLRKDFRFVLSAHPHEYKHFRDDGRSWGAYVASHSGDNILVRDPSEDSAPFIVASDVLLTDHTSLSLYGALLRRPALFIPIDDSLIWRESATWRYREMSLVLGCAGDLGPKLYQTMELYPADALEALAQDMNSYPGQSAERIRSVLYDVMNLQLLAQ